MSTPTDPTRQLADYGRPNPPSEHVDTRAQVEQEIAEAERRRVEGNDYVRHLIAGQPNPGHHPNPGGGKRMRGSDRAMIAVGSVLLALVVMGVVLGAAQDAQFGQFGQKSDQSFEPLQVIFLVVGSLLVLAGVIRDALHRRGL